MPKPRPGKIRICLNHGEDGGTNILQQVYNDSPGRNRYVSTDGVIFICTPKTSPNYWKDTINAIKLAQSRVFDGRITINMAGEACFDERSHAHFPEFERIGDFPVGW